MATLSFFLSALCLCGRTGESPCGVSVRLEPVRIERSSDTDSFLTSIVGLSISNTSADPIVLDYTLLKFSVFAVSEQYEPGVSLTAFNPDLAVDDDRRLSVYSLCVIQPGEKVTIYRLLSDFLPLNWTPGKELKIVARYRPASKYPSLIPITPCSFESNTIVIATDKVGMHSVNRTDR